WTPLRGRPTHVLPRSLPAGELLFHVRSLPGLLLARGRPADAGLRGGTHLPDRLPAVLLGRHRSAVPLLFRIPASISSSNPHIALGIQRHHVARLEPAVGREALLVLVTEVTPGDPGTAHLQLAHTLSVPGEQLALLVYVALLEEGNRKALCSSHRKAGGVVQ